MIAIVNRQPRARKRKLNLRLLEEIAAATLAELKIEPAELEVVLVGAKEMASINQKFLQHEGPTDVITFDYKDADSAVPLHGGIFICPEEAERQSKEFRTSWQSEVVRYVVHGILHLAGHDDLEPAARKKMKRIEGRLVRKLCRRFALSKL